MQRLLDAGRTVMLETGGHLSADDVPGGVIRVIDVKCPGSGESDRMHWPNLDRLRPTDEVKFVITRPRPITNTRAKSSASTG